MGKITAKGQTTVPQEVRASLGAGPGGWLTWELNRDGSATVRRIPLVLSDARSFNQRPYRTRYSEP